MTAPAKPASPTDQADFVLRTLIPYFLNDLEALVESRCPKHGGPGSSPSFSTVFIALAAIEVVASLDASAGLSPKDARRELCGRIGALVGDPRYGDLGELLFVIFRHGIAHTFLPKLTPDVGGMATWIVDAESRSKCINDVRSEIDDWRVHMHLQLDLETLWVYPQVLYLDVQSMLADYRTRLEARDPATMTRLQARFPQFWNDNASLRLDHLNQSERDLVEGRSRVSPIMIKRFPRASFAGRTLDMELQRIQGGFRLVSNNGTGVTTEDFRIREDAEDQAVYLGSELYK